MLNADEIEYKMYVHIQPIWYGMVWCGGDRDENNTIRRGMSIDEFLKKYKLQFKIYK